MLYLVMVPPQHNASPAAVQSVLQPAHSWYRFSPSSWLICTEEPAVVWSQRLAQYGIHFIARFDAAEYQGSMPQEFWDWLQAHPA